jgi:hypothetical protein
MPDAAQRRAQARRQQGSTLVSAAWDRLVRAPPTPSAVAEPATLPITDLSPPAVPHPFHLGRLLAISPDGAAAAIAAPARRLAVLPISAASPAAAASPPGSPCFASSSGGGSSGEGGVPGGSAASGPLITIGEPLVFSGADELRVAGARRCSEGGGGGSAGGAWAAAGLGSIWDMAWLDPGMAPSAAAAAARGGGRAMAVLTHRPNEQSSELLLLRWAPGRSAGGGGGALELLRSVAVPHCGRAAVVGVPGRALAVPGWPMGLALVGDGGVAAVDCAAALREPGPPPAGPDEAQSSEADGTMGEAEAAAAGVQGLEAFATDDDEEEEEGPGAAAEGSSGGAPAAGAAAAEPLPLALAPLLRLAALRGAPRRFGAAGTREESPEGSWGDGMAAARPDAASAGSGGSGAAREEEEAAHAPGSMAAWRRHAWPIEVRGL